MQYACFKILDTVPSEYRCRLVAVRTDNPDAGTRLHGTGIDYHVIENPRLCITVDVVIVAPVLDPECGIKTLDEAIDNEEQMLEGFNPNSD